VCVHGCVRFTDPGICPGICPDLYIDSVSARLGDTVGIPLVVLHTLARRSNIMTTHRWNPVPPRRRGTPTRRCGFCLEDTPVSVADDFALSIQDADHRSLLRFTVVPGGQVTCLIMLEWNLYIGINELYIQYNPPRRDNSAPIPPGTTMTVPRCLRCYTRHSHVIDHWTGTASAPAGDAEDYDADNGRT